MADKKLRVIDETGGKELANAVNTLARIVESLAETVKKIQQEFSQVIDLEKEFNTIKDAVNPVIEFYESFPESDNQTWGIKNRKVEIVAGEGEEVLVQDAATATTLALQSIQMKRLAVMPEDPMFDEVVSLIPEDILNDILVMSASTLENKIVLTEDQKLEEAVRAYRDNKVLEAQRALEQEQALDAMAKGENDKDTETPKIGGLDVEHDKTV